jgi:hypothetical protein
LAIPVPNSKERLFVKPLLTIECSPLSLVDKSEEATTMLAQGARTDFGFTPNLNVIPLKMPTRFLAQGLTLSIIVLLCNTIDIKGNTYEAGNAQCQNRSRH